MKSDFSIIKSDFRGVHLQRTVNIPKIKNQLCAKQNARRMFKLIYNLVHFMRPDLHEKILFFALVDQPGNRFQIMALDHIKHWSGKPVITLTCQEIYFQKKKKNCGFCHRTLSMAL